MSTRRRAADSARDEPIPDDELDELDIDLLVHALGLGARRARHPATR